MMHLSGREPSATKCKWDSIYFLFKFFSVQINFYLLRMPQSIYLSVSWGLTVSFRSDRFFFLLSNWNFYRMYFEMNSVCWNAWGPNTREFFFRPVSAVEILKSLQFIVVWFIQFTFSAWIAHCQMERICVARYKVMMGRTYK